MCCVRVCKQCCHTKQAMTNLRPMATDAYTRHIPSTSALDSLLHVGGVYDWKVEQEQFSSVQGFPSLGLQDPRLHLLQPDAERLGGVVCMCVRACVRICTRKRAVERNCHCSLCSFCWVCMCVSVVGRLCVCVLGVYVPVCVCSRACQGKGHFNVGDPCQRIFPAQRCIDAASQRLLVRRRWRHGSVRAWQAE